MPRIARVIVPGCPQAEDSFARGIGELHRRYTLVVNTREGWRGYLWQGRFLSYPLGETHCYSAVRYVERNPVRAGLVARAEMYEWSSARAHVRREAHPLLAPFPLLKAIPDWSAYLGQKESIGEIDDFRQHERTGRPLGSDEFIRRLEALTGRVLAPRPKGRHRKNGK
ncbi:MAG: transposase [Acidobacteriota bacterium]